MGVLGKNPRLIFCPISNDRPSSHELVEHLMNAVWRLVGASPLHREWAVREIERLFWPPVGLNQIRIYMNPSTLELVGLATWAYMPLSAIEALVAGKLKLEHKHWQGKSYWGDTQTIHTLIVDMIALNGSCHGIVSNLRELFRGQTCFALRRNHGERRLAAFRGYPDVPVHPEA